MDSPHSDPLSALIRIRDCVARGDWTQADANAAEILGQRLELSENAFATYLSHLRETLALARAARANAITALARLNAAAGFNDPGALKTRQNFVVAAIS